MEYYIKNFQMMELFKVGGIFQCFFPKNKVSKFHFLKPPKTFHCLQEIARLQGSLVKLYKELFGYIEKEELKSKKTIVHCFQSLYLSLHPFVPWITLCSS